MKKRATMMLAGFSMLLLASAAAAGEVSYQPGTYTGSFMGRNNDIVVEVTVSENAIEDIQIISESETPGIGTPALETIPGQVVEYQSLAVDGVTGATLTSAAIKMAIADCIDQAGGDGRALYNVEVPEKDTTPIEKEADIVVVGSGGAGFSAAIAAAEAGASVIMVETNGMIGGNTLVSGMDYNAVDPELNAVTESTEAQLTTLKEFLEMAPDEVGVFSDTLSQLQEEIEEYLAGDTTYQFDSVSLHMMQSYLGSRRQGLDGTWIEPRYELLKTFAENSMGSLNWLKGLGVGIEDYLKTCAGGLWNRAHTFKNKLETFQILQAKAEELGVEIMLNTHADELMTNENGRVCGLLATYQKAAPVTIAANKAVILASGGFGGNKQMADEYNNYWPEGSLLNSGSDQIASTQGDGINMALAVGAALEGMGYTQLFPAVNTVTNDIGPCINIDPANAIYINANGERFVNEASERDVMATACLNQPGGQNYQVFDSAYYEERTENGTGPSEEQNEVFLRRGALVKCDTLEDMADYIGCDAETLQATLASYNAAVDAGSDELTGKIAFDHKCETAPFYVCPVAPYIHNTMGGIRINENAEVVDENDEPIPGLYAAGETAGGIHAGNRLGGNAIGEIFTIGQLAGTNAAAE